MFLAVTTSDTQITNLLHLYAELMDAGRLEECCDLFADCPLYTSDAADDLTRRSLCDHTRLLR